MEVTLKPITNDVLVKETTAQLYEKNEIKVEESLVTQENS